MSGKRGKKGTVTHTLVDVLVFSSRTRGEQAREVTGKGQVHLDEVMPQEQNPETGVANLKNLQRLGSNQCLDVYFVEGEKPRKVSLQDMVIDPGKVYGESDRPSIPYALVVKGFEDRDEGLRSRFREQFGHLDALNRQPRLPEFKPGPFSL